MACVNSVIVIIFAVSAAVLGLIASITGIDTELYSDMEQPRFYLPLFFLVLFNIIFYALLGAAAGIVISTPYYRQNNIKPLSLALAAAVLLICYSWVPLVFSAGSFLIATLLFVFVILFSSVIFRFYYRINRAAAYIMILFTVFSVYMTFYTFTLFILN